MTIDPAANELEFSHPISIEKIPAGGTARFLEASPEERHRLAERFDLVGIKKLSAELNVQSARAGQAFAVSGHITADVVQKCVVTLEPVPAHIESDIEALYAIEKEEPDLQAEITSDEVEIEPIKNGVIDLGELVAQNLSIALDPYPRKSGVVFEKSSEETLPTGPLAKLLELKKKD